MMTRLHSPFVLMAALWLGGCAIAPSPPGGPPVVDRSSYRPPPPAIPIAPPPPRTTVEVNPLPRPQPIVTQTPPEPYLPAEPVAPVAPTAPVAAASPPPAAPPAEVTREGNQAVVALLDSAADYVSNGQLDKAAASLERALRIEPRNAGIWHDLGQIKLHQSDYRQAESMASKSNSLAGSNSRLKARNWRLIALARRAQGNGSGADAADAQAVSLGG